MNRLTISQVRADNTHLLCNKMQLNYGPSKEESLILLDYSLIELIAKVKRESSVYELIDGLNRKLGTYCVSLKARSNFCGDNL